MAKRFIVRIAPNGQIDIKTDGIKGKQCVDYIPFFEKILDAQVTDSEFTSEYYEAETEAAAENFASAKNKFLRYD